MASATSAELAPGQLAETFTTGGAICGYCSTGIILSAMAPSRVMTSAITIAKRGRLMKNVSMMAP